MPDATTTQQANLMLPRTYQQEFANQVVNAKASSRFLLSAPPGAGKTVALAAVANVLKAKRGTLRCLSIVPAQLSAMWQEQLLGFGGLEVVAMTPQTYRRLQAESGAGVNVWTKVGSAVASIDFLKSADRMNEVIAAGWDLVLLDEVHRSTDATQRKDVANAIWNAPNVAIAVATTQLPDQPTWLAEDAKTTNVHWRLTDLIAQQMLPERRIHTIHYTPSESERQIAGRIQNMLSQIPNDRQARLTISVLSRRLGSSAYAFEQTLRRLLTVETFGDIDLNDWLVDDLEEGTDSGAIANSFRIDRRDGEEILDLLENEPTDSKWECCFQLLSTHGIGRYCSGLLFTDYADTAEYLAYLAKSRGLKVCLITGNLTTQARQQALHEAQSNRTLLIATGAVEGIDFAFTTQVIHYDLPWNPAKLLQRFGRVERIRPGISAIDHYYILEQSSASEVLSRLMQKLQDIEQEWK